MKKELIARRNVLIYREKKWGIFMLKRLLALLASAMIIGLFFLPSVSLAAPNVTIDSTAGLQNKVKYDKGLPLQFTLTNNGSEFSGDLVVSYSESYNLGAGLSIPIDLASGETKTIQVASSGLTDMSYTGAPSNQSVFLYEGGWEDGKSIKFNGSKTLKPGFFSPSTLFIGSLTSNSDRLQQLKQVMPSNSEGTEIFHLNQMSQFVLPDEALAWEMIDYLVIDEYAYSDLPEPVQQAVLQWVQQGGRVIVGSSGNMAAELGNLSEFLPLELGNEKEQTVPNLERKIPAFEATAKDGASLLLENNGQVLAASQTIGSGLLIQTSFSLGDEAVSSQKGYVNMMSSLFAVKANSYANMGGESLLDRMTYEVGDVNELFESFAVSKNLIIGIIILYIILIIPVLYFVLKKKDKREYAWFIIPAIALLTSLGLFAFGAKDRIGNAQIQQTGFFEADEDGGLNGYYINSLLSNRGGNYQFAAPASTTMSYRMKNGMTTEQPYQAAMMERQAAKNQLTLRDMRYWSVSSVTGQSYIENTGNFDIQLKVENRKIAGTIQNNFPFALEDVAVWTGSRMISLGEISPGEKINVNETVTADILTPATQVGQSFAYQPIQDAKALNAARRQSLLSISYGELEKGGESPYVVGYTEDAIVPITLENQRASVSSVHLIAQSFQPETTLNGSITLNADMFNVEVTGSNPSAYIDQMPEDPYLYYLDDGDYTITYQLANAIDVKKSTWEELNVLINQTNAPFSIYNVKTKKYEEISATSSSFKEESGNYISADGVITLTFKMNAGAMGMSEITLPKLKLKGSVSS
ncbi:hypothetical protein [Planococcus sp. YIM B11945]|uniref:hypothetical protein n=1 Tax=Planococcus sp. YIM B11945 TaxID=3435410 RepID=UPI003D7DF7E3